MAATTSTKERTMATLLNAYLGFDNQAREAMEFYRSVFGGELDITPYNSFGPPDDPADADKVMHSVLKTPAGLTLMGSDAPAGMERDSGSSISLSLSGGSEDDSTLRSYWDGLSAGATITMPLATAQWGDVFGMLTDRYGTQWMVSIEAPKG
jgi:PhnB protein